MSPCRLSVTKATPSPSGSELDLAVETYDSGAPERRREEREPRWWKHGRLARRLAVAKRISQRRRRRDHRQRSDAPRQTAPRGGRDHRGKRHRAHALVRKHPSEHGGAGGPVGGELLQCRLHGRRDMGWHRVAHLAQRTRTLGDDLGDDRLRGGTGKRRLAREHLVRHGAERVDVGPGIHVLLTRRLLRRHVLRRAEGEPGLGQAAAAGLDHRERDTEVGHQRMATLKQDVLGFDISVDDGVLVGVFERVGGLGRDPDDIGDGELAFPDEPVAERLALHVRHHIIEETVG